MPLAYVSFSRQRTLRLRGEGRGGKGGFVVVLSGVVLKSTRWVQAWRILFGYFNIIREVNLFGLEYTGILVLSWFYHCFTAVVGSSKLPLVERLVGLGGEIPY